MLRKNLDRCLLDDLPHRPADLRGRLHFACQAGSAATVLRPSERPGREIYITNGPMLSKIKRTVLENKTVLLLIPRLTF